MFYSRYTHETEERFNFPQNKLHDRYQADYDYEGTTDADGDTADYYRPIYAVRVG